MRRDEAMTKGKRRSGGFEFEWITVTYRTILTWAGVLAGIAAVVGAVSLWRWIGHTGDREEVEREVRLAERSLIAARTDGGASGDELASVEATIEPPVG